MKNESGARKAFRLLTGSEYVEDNVNSKDKIKIIFLGFVCVAMFVILMIMFSGCACANTIVVKGYSNEDICEAIRQAENSRSYPYGIMKKYKHTSPKQACINTVSHSRRNWISNGSKGEFIKFLGSTYAPVGAINDPNNLNVNWVKNVHYFLENDYKLRKDS